MSYFPSFGIGSTGLDDLNAKFNPWSSASLQSPEAVLFDLFGGFNGSKSGNSITTIYPEWVKSDDDKFTYEFAKLENEWAKASAAQQLIDQQSLMDKQAQLNLDNAEKIWKANVDGLRKAGINPILYFAGGSSAGNASVSSGSASMADIPNLSQAAASLRSSAKASQSQILGAIGSLLGSIIGAAIQAAAVGGKGAKIK